MDPSDGFSEPSVPYFVLINRGIKEAGIEKNMPIINTAGNPITLYAKANNKGVNIELI